MVCMPILMPVVIAFILQFYLAWYSLLMLSLILQHLDILGNFFLVSQYFYFVHVLCLMFC